MSAPAGWVSCAGSRILACRVLGIPYPQPLSERPRLDAQAALLDRYDFDHHPFDSSRWLADCHDPGDEDRG